MALHTPTGRAPDRDSDPVDFGTYWLGIAEDEYEARRFDQASAAALIAAGHFQRELATTQVANATDVQVEISNLRESLAHFTQGAPA